MKKILSLVAVFVSLISISCLAQNKIKPITDSVSLSKYLQKIRKELLTKEVIEKNKNTEPIKTLTIVYGEQIILTTAKND